MSYREHFQEKVVIISKKECPSCERLKQLFETIEVSYQVLEFNNQDIISEIKRDTNANKFPFCYIDGKYMGNYEKIEHMLITEKLKKYLDYEIDF